MEDNKTTENKKTLARLRIAVICFAVVLVISSGVFTFLTIKSNNENAKLQDAITSQQSSPEPPIITETLDETKYLVVKEWGIRFQVPPQFASLSYKIVTDNRLEFQGSIKGYVDTGSIKGLYNLEDWKKGEYTFFGAETDAMGFTYTGATGSILRLADSEKNDVCGEYCGNTIAKRETYGFYFGYRIFAGTDYLPFEEELTWYLLNQLASTVEVI